MERARLKTARTGLVLRDGLEDLDYAEHVESSNDAAAIRGMVPAFALVML